MGSFLFSVRSFIAPRRPGSGIQGRRGPLLLLLGGALALAVGAPRPAQAQSPTPNATVENGNGTVRWQSFYDGGLLAPGTFNPTAPNDSIPATGGGTRMMWYPAKAAFRAGRVGLIKDGTQWDAAEVGDYSVAFGVDTKASLEAATAMGSRTTASGNYATAMGFVTTASAEGATTMGRATTASGLHTAAMGLGTEAATDQSLSLGECNNANSGTSGDGTLLAVGDGTYDFGSLSCSPRSDALVLEQEGDLAVGPSTPTTRLHIQDANGSVATSGPGDHVGLVENTNAGDGDVLALQTGPTDPTADSNFLTFFGGGTAVGAIEGDGSGGINLLSGNADFAEALPVADGAAVPEAGDLVGVRGGTASLDTGGADRVMVTSTAPIMTGNAKLEAETERRVEVAFVGQVPARVRGAAQFGDLIVASGREDGTARAVAPEDYRRAEHGPIAGQAWSAKSTEAVGTVTVAVGLGRSGAVAEQLEKQRGRITELEVENEEIQAENEKIKERLAALEARSSSGSIVAGLPAQGLLALLLALSGFGAGLLWRRR